MTKGEIVRLYGLSINALVYLLFVLLWLFCCSSDSGGYGYLFVSVHLHLGEVDGRVNHHPRPAAKLPARGNVHEHYKGGRGG